MPALFKRYVVALGAAVFVLAGSGCEGRHEPGVVALPPSLTAQRIAEVLRAEAEAETERDPTHAQRAQVSFRAPLTVEELTSLLAYPGEESRLIRVYYEVPPRGGGIAILAAGEDVRERLTAEADTIRRDLEDDHTAQMAQCVAGSPDGCEFARMDAETLVALPSALHASAIDIEMNRSGLLRLAGKPSVFAVEFDDDLRGPPLYPDTEPESWF